MLDILKINMIAEGTLKFRLRKIDGTRNYLLDERGRGCWLKGPLQIPTVSSLFHHSLHFHIY